MGRVRTGLAITKKDRGSGLKEGPADGKRGTLYEIQIHERSSGEVLRRAFKSTALSSGRG